ncbi:MAG: DUF5658 family protein [Dehalococcoidia bacterium]
MVLLYFVGLNFADALLTALAIVMGAVEVNPFVDLFSLELGLPKAMLIKILFALALGGVLWQRRKVRLLKVMNYVMLGVVVSNVFVMSYTL